MAALRIDCCKCDLTVVESAFQVAERSDHVEVRGVSDDEVVEALELRDKIRAVFAMPACPPSRTATPS
jgi:hypothetical protein